MRNCIVVVADGTRARIFAFLAGDRRGLIELEDLINPEYRLRAGEIYAHDRPGIKAEGATGVRAGMAEPRRDRFAASERHFAVQVLGAASSALADRGSRELVLVAAPAMLGTLRAEAGRLGPVTIHELNKNLTT